MNYAIIAAGDGSRLAQEGISQPKPLVLLHGETMIDRLIRVFLNHGATSITIIINEKMPQVVDHLKTISLDIPFRVIEASTPSSMHSFYELSKFLPQGKFCLTTVDTIFPENDFAEFIRQFEDDETADGLFAVTPFVDDEKPLYVAVDSNQFITGFYDLPHEDARFISGGIYCLKDTAIPILHQAIAKGDSRMRNYQRSLIQAQLKVKAHIFDKIIDVDHAQDIETALSMLKS